MDDKVPKTNVHLTETLLQDAIKGLNTFGKTVELLREEINKTIEELVSGLNK